MAAQHDSPVGVVVVVPMTWLNCNDTGEGCGFRGDRAEGLNVVGEAVGVVRIAEGGPFSLVRRL